MASPHTIQLFAAMAQTVGRRGASAAIPRLADDLVAAGGWPSAEFLLTAIKAHIKCNQVDEALKVRLVD